MTAFAHLVQAWAAILLTFAHGAGDAGVLAPGTDQFERCPVAREKRDVGPVGAGVERSQTLDFGHDDRCLTDRVGRHGEHLTATAGQRVEPLPATAGRLTPAARIDADRMGSLQALTVDIDHGVGGGHDVGGRRVVVDPERAASRSRRMIWRTFRRSGKSSACRTGWLPAIPPGSAAACMPACACASSWAVGMLHTLPA